MRLLVLYLFLDYIPGALLKQTCKHYDVAKYLNITEREDLLLMTMPKNNWTEPLLITVDLVFISILDVMWKNDFLSWDPQQFCNISHITVPLSYFWVPDLYFLEQVVEDASPWMRYANVSHEGIITALKPMRLTSTCILDFYYFPFDIQKCSVTITSTMHLESSIVLKSLKNSSEIRSEEEKFVVDHGEWHPLDLVVKEKPLNGYSTLLCTVVIQRQSSLYVFALILPSFFLLILDLLSFYIPRSYNEKISFKITVLLGISVLTLILNDLLPASSDAPPIIVLFVIGTMSLMTAGILETIFVMYIGGKILRPDSTSAKTNLLYEGNMLKSCSEEVKLEEEKVLEGGVVWMLERICRDMHLVKEQILSLRSTKELEAKCAMFQEKIEKLVFYIHLVLVTAFYVTLFIKWKW
ncbi:5-hydroxytryptamine receptor 3A-like [Hyla sarda]|uniref:5-hydroxytryptamine receptor 3A-like n=1 Tax=Hyla sarda TaxID=327740 RepID=UPI0024C2E689|nr:5-hydroxytryptamine receptor 3A-like [Hyla sarda]